MSETSLQKVESLISMLQQKGADGDPRFPKEDVLEFFPLLLLSAVHGLPAEIIPDEISVFLGEFSQRIGVSESPSRDEVNGKINAYYEKNPINPELAAACKKLISDLALKGGMDSDSAEAFAKFAGSTLKFQDPKEPSPEGSVPGGPMARFNLDGK